MADPAGFLARWSRLKEGDRKEARRQDRPSAPTAAPDATAPAGEAAPAELPPLESLTKDSDFRPFMQPGVPDELRNQALRKLWSSDPIYANLDGLLEYGEDFAAPFRIAGVVATVYRVLEGMPGPDAPMEPPLAPSEPADAVTNAAESAEQPAEEAAAVVERDPRGEVE